MYGMTAPQQREASRARQRRAEADAEVERAARIANHRESYLKGLREGPRRPDQDVREAVARDRRASAHRDYLAARAVKAEAYGGDTAGIGARLALAEHDAGERIAARKALAELVGASSYDELAAEVARRGLEL